MSDETRAADIPADEEERAAAARLARSLEAGTRPSGDPEVARVVGLFQSLAADRADEVGLRRVRERLAEDAGCVRRRSYRGAAVAAAAVVVAGALAVMLLLRPHGGPSAATLEEREHRAQEAFASVAGAAPSSNRQARIYDRQWGSRLESVLQDQRFNLLAEQASTGASRSTQNPGGAS